MISNNASYQKSYSVTTSIVTRVCIVHPQKPSTTNWCNLQCKNNEILPLSENETMKKKRKTSHDIFSNCNTILLHFWLTFEESFPILFFFSSFFFSFRNFITTTTALTFYSIYMVQFGMVWATTMHISLRWIAFAFNKIIK